MLQHTRVKLTLLNAVFLTNFFFVIPVHAAVQSNIQDITSWVYQLQDADTQELAATDYDLVVMDYSLDGTDDEAYTLESIETLQASGKTVLAYFSIGEAEDYRFYWQDDWSSDAPSWLGPENPEWEGNYKVKYWEAGWWDTALEPYLARIQNAGFDGVYLDIIDAFEYWGEQEYTTKQSAQRMIKLIQRINTTLDTQADSIVCPQNGEAIIDYVNKKSKRLYWDSIDCIGIEDLFYHSSKSDRKYRKKLLRRFANKNKVILNVEYIKDEKNTAYLKKATQANFPIVTYRADPSRELDTF